MKGSVRPSARLQFLNFFHPERVLLNRRELLSLNASLHIRTITRTRIRKLATTNTLPHRSLQSSITGATGGDMPCSRAPLKYLVRVGKAVFFSRFCHADFLLKPFQSSGNLCPNPSSDSFHNNISIFGIRIILFSVISYLNPPECCFVL